MMSTPDGNGNTNDGASSNIGLSDVSSSPAGSKQWQQQQPPASGWWKSNIDISIAKSRKVRGGNFVQLSTVDPTTNEPRCRSVVFRGFQPMDSGTQNQQHITMRMITDLRSEKVKELTAFPDRNTAELLWWFQKSSEQYRIRGNVELVGDDQSELPSGTRGNSEENEQHRDFLQQARKQQWGNLSDNAREQFYWKDPGSMPYETQNVVPVGGRDEDGKVLPPPKEFLLLLLHPRRVDFLRLTDNYRQIDLLNHDNGEWNLERVNP